jgi:hypothetical protein
LKPQTSEVNFGDKMKKEPAKEAPKKKSGFADFWSKAAKPSTKT